MKNHVRDLGLAAKGALRIEWAEQDMPVLRLIRARFEKQKPLKGVNIAACLHVTSETAVLARTLAAGGARVSLCASNPLSTQDDVAAALVKNDGMAVYAIKGEDQKTYYSHINAVIDSRPALTMDDGADLVSTLHKDRRESIGGVIGGTEETTTGVVRLRSMAAEGALKYPIVAVNDALTKHMFDNRYGTGQSTLDGIQRATNRLIAGSQFVVCGYGWCGRGLAMRANGQGASVIVTEVDPVRALEAVMDGFRVMPIARAARIGDIFCTVTGDINVIRREHFATMKDGAVVSNSGHFNVELELTGLAKIARARRQIREYVEEFTLPSGRRIYVLAEGRLVNLAAAEGHPACVMDMSFANQALCAEYMVNNHSSMKPSVIPVPEELDRRIASIKLASLEVKIDRLTPEQRKYLASWQEGT
jgi:adenosylhomocysteinase